MGSADCIVILKIGEMEMVRNEQFIQGITDLLMQHGVVGAQDGTILIENFNRSSIDSYVEFLISEGIVQDISLLRILGEYFKVPIFDVVGYFFDYTLLHQFPKSFLLRNEIIPLEVDAGIMVMVASDPSNDDLLPLIGKYVGYEIQFRVGIARNIIDAIEEYYDTSLTQDDTDSDLNREHRLEQEAERIENGDDQDGEFS